MFRKVYKMKKALRIILPILFAIAVIFSLVWYLFVYDREFTRDTLLSLARYSESQGNHSMATWFYNTAYSQSGNDDAVAIELAEQYRSSGNYTKAEYTLSNAIRDGGGIDLYIALSKVYVEQDKLLDAANMLDGITNPEIKAKLDELRPAPPAVAPAPGFYNQYISVTLTAENEDIFATLGNYPSKDDVPYSQPIALGDGENKIYALTIGDNGLVSSMAVYGYTVGGVVKEMEFADPAVETAVRTLLNVTKEKVIFTNDLWEIKEFAVPKDAKELSDVANMVFIEKLTVDLSSSADVTCLSSLTTLTELNINNATVSRDMLKTISAMPKLKKLSLTNCYLSSVEPLSSATGLQYLNLSNNAIRDLTPLSGLRELQELHLASNAVIDLAPVAALTKLNKLDVSYNTITTLSPISTCVNLTWLNAGVNTIAELGAIDQLTRLQYVNLESNKITDVSPLSACTEIEELNISSNSITDIKSLSALNKMTTFNFSHNTVKELPAFSKDCALVTIDGSYNTITKLDKLKGLEHLNIVNMDYNSKLSSVTPLEDCPVLVQVNVYGTKVKNVSGLLDLGIVVNYTPV